MSDASVQTAYRVPHDEYDLTEQQPPSPIGTPSISRNAYLHAPADNSAEGLAVPVPVGSIRRQRSHRKIRSSSSTSLDRVASPPVQQRTGPEPNKRLSSKPKRTSRGTNRSSAGLDEVAVPPPVQSENQESGWQRDEHLEDEDRTSGAENQDHAPDQAEPEGSALPPPAFAKKSDSPDYTSDKKPSTLATQLYIYSYLIFFALLGTLARLGVQWLTFYSGAPLVTSVTWANVGGSLCMGFLSEDRKFFRDEWGVHSDAERKQRLMDEEKYDETAAKKTHAKVKKTIPLYIGLATGFCGSFTSFSSFMRDVFLALSNNLPTPDNHPYSGISAPSFTSTVHRNGGYSLMALLAVMFYTVALSLAALFVGAHVAIALDPWTPTLPFTFTRRVLDRSVLLLGPLCWLGAIFLAIWPPDRPSGPSTRGSWANEVWRGEVLFALVFAPLGCLLRYYASIKLNGTVASFPLGTFAVNVFGCAVEAMLYDIQHVPILSVEGGLVGGGRVGCQVLQGIMDGFCGCLTTVSTWVAELQGLRRRHAYIYGAATLGAGLSLMVIIMGSVRWTVGWSDTVCVTMRTSS